MNFFDLLIFGIVLLSILYSFFRGFIREVFSLVSLILGIWLAMKFYPLIGDRLSSWVTNSAVRNLIGFSFIFIVVRVSGWWLGSFIQKLLNLGKIRIWDRGLGMLVGLTKGIIIVTFLITILVYFLPVFHPLLRQSKLSPYVIEIVEKFPLSFLPEKVKDKIEKKRKELIYNWDNKVTEKKEQSDSSQFF